jgi:hypothetical protein
MDFDVDELLRAVGNETNETMMSNSFERIENGKLDVFANELELNKVATKDFMKRLREYMFIDDIKEIKYGSYIRWISLKNPGVIKLTTGGFICDIKKNKSEDDIIIFCKNRMNMVFQLKMSEAFIFQKLTLQEKTILNAVELVKGVAI